VTFPIAERFPGHGGRLALAAAGAFLLLLSSANLCASSAGERMVRSGTAFFVARAGYLLTSAHVVAGCPRLSLRQEGGPPREATLVDADAARDIALLRSSGAVPGYATLSARGEAPPGTRVLIIGFALDPSDPGLPTLSDGAVVGPAVLRSGQRLLVIEGTLHEGSSGGPVIGRDGTLEGMIIGADRSRPEHGVAVPADDIGEFLRAHGIAYRTAMAARAPAPEPARLLRRIAALVQCTDANSR